jgi:glycosyltransferase involved in cell wall biosynthesis
MDYNGVKVMQQGSDATGQDLSPLQVAWWISRKPEENGVGIMLYDVWPLKNPAWLEVPIAAWTPIDHANVTPGVAEFFSRTGMPRWPIAMSKFGKQAMLEAGIPEDIVMYSPHAFDGKKYFPKKSSDRKALGVPEDAHLTSIVAANKGLLPIRKCFPEMLSAWSKFAETREDAYLYIHSEVFGISEGVNIPRYLQMIGAPTERIVFVDQFSYRQGIPQENLAGIYSQSDVLLATSRGEGFGVPVIEAQACGTPVIVTDFSAQTELVGPGWMVKATREWDELQQGWWGVPDVDEITAALEESYKIKSSPEENSKIRSAAINFARQYEADTVYKEYWLSIISRLEQEVSGIKLEFNFK